MQLASLHLLNLLEYAACKGIGDRALQSALVTPDPELRDEQGRVGADEYRRVWERITELSADDHLGLHYGYFLNLKALGLIYRISLAASSIEQALGLLEEYLNTTFPLVTLATGVSKDFFYIELHSPLGNDPTSNQILDSVLFLMYREIGLMIEGEIAEVHLPSDGLQEYRRFCPATLVGSKVHGLKLANRQLAGEINRRRIKNLEALLPVFLQLIGRSPEGSSSFAEQVRKMTLNLCSPELPVLDQVVAQFAVSQRTFQRKLTEEGTSFRTIADDIKRQIAGHLERGNNLGTQDIAYLLGYSEASAYLHALKKWKNRPAP